MARIAALLSLAILVCNERTPWAISVVEQSLHHDRVVLLSLHMQSSSVTHVLGACRAQQCWLRTAATFAAFMAQCLASATLPPDAAAHVCHHMLITAL